MAKGISLKKENKKEEIIGQQEKGSKSLTKIWENTIDFPSPFYFLKLYLMMDVKKNNTVWCSSKRIQ